MSLGVDFERYQFDRRLKDLQDKVLSLNYRTSPDATPKSLPSEPALHNYNNQYYQRPQYYPNQFVQPIGFTQNTQRIEESSSSEEEEQQIKLPAHSKTPSLQQIPVRNAIQGDIIRQQRKQQKKWLEQIIDNDKQQEQQLLGYIEQQNQVIKQLTDRMLDDKKKQEKIAKQKKEMELRQLEMKQFEDAMLKRQDVMLQHLKKDILDNYYGYHNMYNYIPQQQQFQTPQYGQQMQMYGQFPYNGQQMNYQQQPYIQFQNQIPFAQNPSMPPMGYNSPTNTNSFSVPKLPQIKNNSQMNKMNHHSKAKIDNLLNGI